MVRQVPSGLDVRRDVGKRELHLLEVEYLLTELLSLARIPERSLERTFRQTQRERRDADPARPGLERNHHELMALCAPRSLMVIGCSMDKERGGAHSDDLQSWAYFQRAKEVDELLGIPDHLQFAATRGGHKATSPEIDRAWQAFFESRLKR